MVAIGLHIEDWIKNFQRKARMAGYSVVRIPTEQPLRTCDYLKTTLSIPVASPRLRLIVEQYLLHQAGFVLDFPARYVLFLLSIDAIWSCPTNWWCLSSSRRQYMHTSGMAMVRVVSHGFLWVDNHLNDVAAVFTFCSNPISLHLFMLFAAIFVAA
jgi:hypothetical protein